MKFAIYARKSTESEDRQVLSIDSQVEEMRKVADAHGLEVAHVLKESQSASKLGRPVFAALMQKVLDGEIDGILCWKLDRLARNPIDGGQVIWAMKENGLMIRTPAELYSADKENVIMLYIEFGMAQKYTDDLSRNVKRGNAKKVELGQWCGVAPMGYLNRLDDHTIVADPERFDMLRRTWELLLKGVTPEDARRTLNDDWGFRSVRRKRIGGSPMAKSSMYKMIRNPFYCGIIKRVHDGELKEYRGSHPPMVTEDEFWRVQKMLGLPVPRPQTKNFAYKRLIRCGECGCGVTAEEHFKKSGLRYAYYHCTRKKQGITCEQLSVTEAELNGQIGSVLESISLPPQFVTWAKKWLRHLNEQEADRGTVTRESLQRAYNDIQTKIDRLTDMRLNDLLTEAEFKAKREELTNERSGLKAKLDDGEQTADDWIERVEGALVFAQHVSERFASAGETEKGEILAALGSNFLLHDQKLRVELDKTWSAFAEAAPMLQMDVKGLELDESGAVNEKTPAFTDVFPRWQGL